MRSPVARRCRERVRAGLGPASSNTAAAQDPPASQGRVSLSWGVPCVSMISACTPPGPPLARVGRKRRKEGSRGIRNSPAEAKPNAASFNDLLQWIGSNFGNLHGLNSTSRSVLLPFR